MLQIKPLHIPPLIAIRFIEGETDPVEVVSHLNCGTCMNYNSQTQTPPATGVCKLSGRPVYAEYDCHVLSAAFKQKRTPQMCDENRLYNSEVAQHHLPRLEVSVQPKAEPENPLSRFGFSTDREKP